MKVSVIIPCYNEEEVLPLSHKRFSQVMGSTAHDYELIFVNDGSKDHTEELLLGFANDDPHTKVISFSRNFGHQNAVSAGLHNCTGDIAVIPLYGGGDESKASGNTAYFVNNGMIYTVCIRAPQPGIGDARLRPYLKQVLDAFYAP